MKFRMDIGLQIRVTIQTPIRKTAVSQRSFTHVVTSPYKICQMCSGMQAFRSYLSDFAWL